MKKYKCVYDYPVRYIEFPERNGIYSGDYTWGSKSFSVEELAQKNPEQWELIVPDKWYIRVENMDSEIKNWFRKKTDYDFMFGLPNYGNYSNLDAGNFGGIFKEDLLKESEELTQYEFKQFIIKEKEFILPEKWFIKVPNEKDCTEFHNYFNATSVTSVAGFWFYTNDNGIHNRLEKVFEDYQEITIDQFKKYVMNKQELTFPREMLVWDSNEHDARKQTVHAYIPTLKSPWITSDLRWNNAKELPKKTLPTIGGYKGQVIDKETIKYGCTTVDVGHLSDLYNSAKNCTKGIAITSVKLDNGQEVSLDEIAQILDYFK